LRGQKTGRIAPVGRTYRKVVVNFGVVELDARTAHETAIVTMNDNRRIRSREVRVARAQMIVGKL